MAKRNEEGKRAESWLTRGRPRAIRTRGAVRTRGGAVAAAKEKIRYVRRGEELLALLAKDVPHDPWVVVVEGSMEGFAADLCLQVKSLRETSKFVVVSPKEERDDKSTLAALNPLSLNPLVPDDHRFLENLVADLVIVPAAPEASQGERLGRWLYQARYILAERLTAPLLDELHLDQPVGPRRAEIYGYRP